MLIPRLLLLLLVRWAEQVSAWLAGGTAAAANGCCCCCGPQALLLLLLLSGAPCQSAREVIAFAKCTAAGAIAGNRSWYPCSTLRTD
jgi:hypothetical protein